MTLKRENGFLLTLMIVAILAGRGHAEYALVGAGMFKCRDTELWLESESGLKSLRDWAEGYWDAMNMQAIRSGQSAKNIGHESVSAQEFTDRIRLQCAEQPSDFLMTIIEQVYRGLPNIPRKVNQ